MLLTEWAIVGDGAIAVVVVVVPLLLKVSGLKLRERWQLQLFGIEWG